ncbi:hypothetical protein BDZ89DRAFT_942674, partial [Hymenopellis radicata]
REIKPENFALGWMEEQKRLYLIDMGLCKLYMDHTTGQHIPFRAEAASVRPDTQAILCTSGWVRASD